MAQQCAPKIRAILFCCICAIIVARGYGQDSWKKLPRAEFKNRYEALIDVQTSSSHDFELLSFTSYVQLYQGSQEWVVWFPAPSNATAVVYARDVSGEFQYRMESFRIASSSQPWKSFDGWMTGEVLSKSTIPPSDIGIIVRLTPDGEKVAPAIAVPRGATLPHKVDTYHVVLRPGNPLQRVDFTLSGIKKGIRSDQRGSLPQSRVTEETFLLKLDVRDYDPGDMSLVISGYVGKAIICSKQLNFYHNPDVRP